VPRAQGNVEAEAGKPAPATKAMIKHKIPRKCHRDFSFLGANIGRRNTQIAKKATFFPKSFGAYCKISYIRTAKEKREQILLQKQRYKLH
jgi:hypothetical protein